MSLRTRLSFLTLESRANPDATVAPVVPDAPPTAADVISSLPPAPPVPTDALPGLVGFPVTVTPPATTPIVPILPPISVDH